jgi:putative ABC transport system ATP-binding protein
VSEPVLSVDRVNVTFGTGAAAVHVLSDVSLEFPSGAVTLIMGPSGSGKTTLLSVLGCLLQPQAGSVRVSGKDVTMAGEEECTRIRREEIGFVFQSFRLFNSLNALENVMLAMEISGEKGPVEGRAISQRSGIVCENAFEASRAERRREAESGHCPGADA